MLALSPLDCQRFGFPVAKGSFEEAEAGGSVADAARRIGARLAIVRLPAQSLDSVHALEAQGAILCDTLVYYRRRRDALPQSQLAQGYSCTPSSADDADGVEALARAAFSGYFGHYHADPRIDAAARGEIYPSWARRCCLDQEAANHVLVIRAGKGEPVAFLALKRRAPGQFEIVLNGVAPQHRNKGLYRFLLDESWRWSMRQNASALLVSTQVTNLAAQRLWCRAGFEPTDYFYTFHLWLDG